MRDTNHAIGVILNLPWGPNNFSPSMIQSWRKRGNSRTGLGAELFLPAKSAFCICGLFYFFLYYRHFFSFFLPYLLFLLGNYVFYVFFDTVLVLVAWFFSLSFPSICFFFYYPLLVRSQRKVIIQCPSPLSRQYFHTDIRFRYGHRKRASAQPLEDISSEWNPQPPC